MSALEWIAIAVGGLVGWGVVSWVIEKVQTLNERPSPFDEEPCEEIRAKDGLE